MGEVLGIGITHAPMFQFHDNEMVNVLKRSLRRPDLPEKWKDSAQWPEAMRDEWGDDEGITSAKGHRETVVAGFRRARKELDNFEPDCVLIFGDDQYENFQEDIIPTFCLYMFEELTVNPYRTSGHSRTGENVWGIPAETEVVVRGHLPLATQLAGELIGRGFDIAWATKPNHHPTLGHAFMRTLAYLDYDQQGFNYPIVPFHLNAYGSDVAARVDLFENSKTIAPPAPSPSRCFALGAAVGEIIRNTNLRVAIVGSSSWSHGFLTEKNDYVIPDTPTDRKRISQLRASKQREWAELTLEEVRDAGEHELLNWICMAGALADARAEVITFAETYIFNSTKVIAVLHDEDLARAQ